MSLTRPSSARRSSVAGCVVAARGSACKPSLSSNKRTGMPWRPKCQAHSRPTGPPPAISTLLFSSDISRAQPRIENRRVRNLLKMAGDASAERLNMRPHGALRRVAIMRADGGKNGFVLLLEAVVVIRRGKRNKPKAQRPLVELSHHLGQLEVFRRIRQDEMKFTVERHESVNIARGDRL